MPLPPTKPLEEKYQELLGNYYLAQAEFYYAMHQCEHLQAVLRAKQAAILDLLPHYPHPVSAALQASIELG